MSKTKWTALLFMGTVFCLLVIAGIVLALFLLNKKLPLYTMQQAPSTHTGYYHTTLTSGSTVYVMDFEEYALLPINTEPFQIIGRFPVTIGKSGLYVIPGQDPSAYALEYDPMYQQVYRNIDHPPFDWRAAEFQMMRLMLPNSPIETTDPLVINNALNALHGQTYFTLPMQANGNYTGYENYSLLLFSDELPGLMYSAGVHVDSSGQVYLAENFIANRWVYAGKLFTEWMSVPQ